MIKLLADAKIRKKKARTLQRFVWGRRAGLRPKPTPSKHVYRIYDSSKRVLGEYSSLKQMAKYAFNGALSREELVARMRHKLPYNGCTIVKEFAPETPYFYRKNILLPVGIIKSMEVLAANAGVSATTLIRKAIADFVNQEVAKLPDHLKEHL